MSTFVVPAIEGDESKQWPTLGPQVRQLIEERAIHGPGDLRGKPATIDAEKAALIDRIYQVFPHGHPRAGRRRFSRVAISVRKGSAKTELAAWVMFSELHPEGPVRCDGFKKQGKVWVPVGRPVTDPYIPMVAYTEDQTEELAYGALLCVCSEGPDVDLFDPTKERITRAYGDGKAEAVANAPDSKDGARTTCQHYDESHRMTSPRHKATVQTMRNNLPKRVLADAWEFETTTTYQEGQGAVAEDTHTYAEDVAAGKKTDQKLFFFYRQAEPKPNEDLDDPEQCRAAIREASGPALALWPHFDEQVDAIMALRNQPDTDKSYWERVWLNRRVSSESSAFNVAEWKELARPDIHVPELAKEPITLGFDGARWRDGCGFIATHIESALQWPHAAWENTYEADDWEVTDEQVDGALDEAMQTYRVFLLYGDPPRFEANLARWAGKYGDKRVLEWYTNRPRQIGQAMRAYRTAMATKAVTHNGDEMFARHIANARKGKVTARDDDDTPLWTIYKERPDSIKYIDLAMAGCLSWQARIDALARGGWKRPSGKMIIRRG